MGVLPLQFQAGTSAASLGLTGASAYGRRDRRRTASRRAGHRACADGDARSIEFQAVVRIDTPEELVAFRHGGILPVRAASAGRQAVAAAAMTTRRTMDGHQDSAMVR